MLVNIPVPPFPGISCLLVPLLVLEVFCPAADAPPPPAPDVVPVTNRTESPPRLPCPRILLPPKPVPAILLRPPPPPEAPLIGAF